MKRAIFLIGAFIAFVAIGNAQKSHHQENILRIRANISVDERIARGNYNWVSSDITEWYSPTNIPADYYVEYKLFHFNRNISSYDVIKEMGKEGFLPATLSELLALGETQPELQKQFPIIAFGSVLQGSDGDRVVPCLVWFGSERRGLGLVWFGNGWPGHCRFLGVRK